MIKNQALLDLYPIYRSQNEGKVTLMGLEGSFALGVAFLALSSIASQKISGVLSKKVSSEIGENIEENIVRDADRVVERVKLAQIVEENSGQIKLSIMVQRYIKEMIY